MVTPRGYVTACNNAIHLLREIGGTASARSRRLGTKVGCLFVVSAAGCGSSGTEYETRADFDLRPSTTDVGEPSAPEGESGSDTSSGSSGSSSAASSSSAHGASEPTTSPATDATVHTEVTPTSTQADETSLTDDTSEPTPAPIEDPEEFPGCTVLHEGSEERCRYARTCEVSAATSNLEAQCFPRGNEHLDCWCGDFFERRSFLVEGGSLEHSCLDASQWCEQLTLGEVTCSAQDFGEVCSVDCGQEVVTGSPTVRAWLMERSPLHCETLVPGGDWYCGCWNAGLSPVMPSSSTPKEACLDAVNICPKLDLFEPVGAPNCAEMLVYEETPSSCSVGTECQQPAVSGEYSVALRGITVITGCELTEAGTWQCYCADSFMPREYVEVEAATSSEACTNVNQTCVTAARFVWLDDGSPTLVFGFDD
jgi:hypothetical protein